MSKLVLENKKLVLTDEIDGFVVKTVTKFGNGAKVDCQKEYIGRTVYLVICKEGV